LTREAFGQSREAHTGGTILENLGDTEDIIGVLAHGRPPKKKEGA
jgi:hypothetical protein